MKEGLVSVVVPIYNGEKYLKECIESILNQTYSMIEIILVDDGSTDSSRKICGDLADIDDRISLIFREKNGGVSECRVSGVEAASGEWLIFVDHDDTITEDCIETFVKAGELNDDIDVVCGNVAETSHRKKGYDDIPIIDNGLNVISRYYDDPMIKSSHESKLYKMSYLKNMDISKYRRLCPIAFFDDIVITPILLGEAKKVAILPGVFYLHREVMTSISRSNLLNSFYYDHMEAGNIMLKYFKKKNCIKSFSHKLSRYMRDILRIYCLMDYFHLENSVQVNYEELIIKYYKKYRQAYLKYGDERILIKIVFFLFGVSPKLWKKLIQHTYYKNYKEVHNL